MSPHVLNYTFERIRFDKSLVFEFFIKFSLFENALKSSGFYKQSGRNGIKPNWEKFSEEIEQEFSRIYYLPYKHELNTAVQYFLDFPPRKQGIDGGELTFKDNDLENKTLSEQLSILIRCVRNNLFHGGKFEYERPRDTLLIQFSIIILEEWAEIIPSVRNQLNQIR
jgi:hypothetical protein